MRLLFRLVFITAFLGIGSAASAQQAYDEFVGQYLAARDIAKTCKGIFVLDEQSAGQIAKTKHRLRKQRFLVLVFYAQEEFHVYVRNKALKDRGIDRQNKKQLCRFGRKIANKNDAIGRFLRLKQ